MKLLIMLSLLTMLPLAGFAEQAGSLGLGGMVGQPTGGTLKYWLTETTAIDGAIGAQFEHPDDHFCNDDDRRLGRCDDFSSRVNLHGDFLWHFDPFVVNEGRLPLYLGFGGRLIAPDTEFGLRFPFGIEYLFKPVALGIFAEIAPVFTVVPYTGVDLDGSVGVRYYFGANAIRHR